MSNLSNRAELRSHYLIPGNKQTLLIDPRDHRTPVTADMKLNDYSLAELFILHFRHI